MAQTVIPTGIPGPQVEYGASTSRYGSVLYGEGSPGTPTIVGETVTVAPDGIATAEAFGIPAANKVVSPQGIDSQETFGEPSIFRDNKVFPDGIATGEAVSDPVVIWTVLVEPNGIDSQEVFGTLVVNTVVGPSSINPTSGFGEPLLVQESIVFPDSIEPEEEFGEPILVGTTPSEESRSLHFWAEEGP